MNEEDEPPFNEPDPDKEVMKPRVNETWFATHCLICQRFLRKSQRRRVQENSYVCKQCYKQI
jgi:predicted SprT family Zn-dependent metalloprotease